MPDPPFRLVADPPAVMAHVVRKALQALPPTDEEALILLSIRIHRRLVSELRRDVDHRLVDQHCNRVQIAGVTHKPETLCFERQCAAACERIVECRQDVPVEQLAGAGMVRILRTSPAPALPNFLTRSLQDLLVCSVLPLD